MFRTHLNDSNKQENKQRNAVLFFAIEGTITHSYNDLQVQHCQLISDIKWDDKHLCATVFQMNVELALFLMNNMRFLPINRMIIVAEPDMHNADLAMVSAERIDPVSFLQISKDCGGLSEQVDEGTFDDTKE